MFLGNSSVRIQVNESFGGIAPGVREVDVLTGMERGNCGGIPPGPSGVYLIGASVGKDGALRTSRCSYTPIEYAAADLRILRARRDGQRVPSLTGQIMRPGSNFYDPRPLGNVRVRVKSDRKLYETQADPQGLYAFYDLPSGRYEFAPDLPPDTTLFRPLGDRSQVSIELSAAVCKEHNVQVFAGGSIP